MPRLVEQTHTTAAKHVRPGIPQTTDCIQSLDLHSSFNGTPLEVELVQALGELARLSGIVREQAFDPYGHVVNPTSGIQSRCNSEREIRGCQIATFALCDIQKRADSRYAPSRAYTADAL